MDYEQYTVRKILDSVLNGAVRIPAFQRGFVWDMDRVAHLLDSIYKGYPLGSLLFWRTRNQLAVERDLGAFRLPEPKVDYPIDYVLDGQQRLTSVFTVFQTDLEPRFNPTWQDVYFDMNAEENAQASLFTPLAPSDVNLDRHFPMKVLFDSARYRQATETLQPKQIERMDKLQERFKEITVPVQVLKTEDRSMVAIVFERVNRLGVALDTLQLLSAWTWSEDFDLIERFRELKEELSEYGFEGVGEDADLILDCAAAVLKGQPGADKLLELNGKFVRENFGRVENGIRGAIDFLRTQFRVVNLKLLPYPGLLVPLVVFFESEAGKERVYGAADFTSIRRWFWRSCFSGRYGSQTTRAIVRDIEEMRKLRNGLPHKLDDLLVAVNEGFFLQNTFRIGTAFTKSFVLMLANNSPKSLFSGKEIDLDKTLQRYNRSEFHHIYPRAMLRDNGIDDDNINLFANFCFLSSAENKQIGRKRPSDYVRELAPGSLDSAFCTAADFDDRYEAFVVSRSRRLAAFATSLMQ